MNIVFLGNFGVDFSSESHYLKTLRDLGHTVYPLQEGKTNSSQILKRAVEADLFLWVHTHEWVTEGMAEVLEILKEEGVPTVGYHLDLWLGIEREKDLRTDPYWNIEYFFSVDQLMVDLLNTTEGMPKAFFLPAGVFKNECYISQNHRPEYKYDVVFTGSGNYHKEWPYRKELILWLRNNYGDRFGHFGSGGEPNVRGQDLNDLYANAKIVIGDTLCKGFNYPYYLSDRIFEVTGRGGFIIHPYIKGIGNLFELGKVNKYTYDTDKMEIATYEFGDFEHLKYQIDFFLKNENEREKIRLAGHERTKQDHTYHNRMKYILETIESENNQG